MFKLMILMILAIFTSFGCSSVSSGSSSSSGAASSSLPSARENYQTTTTNLQFTDFRGLNWKLVWSDEFDDMELNISNNWSIETGTGINGNWGTGQLDYASSRTNNIRISNGNLIIALQQESYNGRSYTSGRINSKDKAYFRFGRIEARVKPAGIKYQGQGFAFWLQPNESPDGFSSVMWPQGGEVDIMEYVGSIPYYNLGSVHYAWSFNNNQYSSGNHGQQGGYYNYDSQDNPAVNPGYGNYPPTQPSFSDDYHIYGIYWTTNKMEFYVDDHVYHIHYFNDRNNDGQDQSSRIANPYEAGKYLRDSEYSHHFPEWHPFEHSMYIILSAGVGGSTSTYGGIIVTNAVFPAEILVDWVRVYKQI